MDGRSLVRQLKERKLVQWGIGYGASSVVLLELADILGGEFGWPAPTLRVLTVLLIAGFLATLVIAWYHGEQGHQRAGASELLVLALIAVTGGGAAWWVGMRPTDAAATRAADSTNVELADLADSERSGVAVLPFVSIGEDAENASFADGITEDIIAEVSRISGLRVISRTSVMPYRDTDKGIPQIGRELGVQAILEGSVRRVGDQLRIVAQLIDAGADEHLWTGTYDADISAILQTQSEVAQDIASNLREALGDHVQLADTGDRPAIDPAAFDMYMEGRRLAASERPEERERAGNLLEDAVARDSNLVAAYSVLAEIAAPPMPEMSELPYMVPPDPRTTEMVERALRRAPDLPALRTFSIRRALDHGDFARAEREARRAIADNPNNPAAHRYLALLFGRTGQFDEALTHLHEAQSLDPRSATLGTDMGEMLQAAGRTGEAIAQFRKVLGRHPDHVPARVGLGLAHLANGDGETATAVLREAAEQAGTDPIPLGALGHALAAQGHVDQARAVLDSLRSMPAIHGPARIAIARVLEGLGDHDQAARLLERAFGEGTPGEPGAAWLRLDPMLRGLFGDSIPRPPGRPPRNR